MARVELSVEKREVKGKKVAKLRRTGVLPGNVFGRGLDSVAVQMPGEAMDKTLRASSVNEVIDLKIAGERNARPVVIQKLQRHPLTSQTLHADFFQVSLRDKMRADVPLVLVGSSDAVNTYNGVLVQSLEALHVEALPLDLPSRLEVDVAPLTALEMSLHVRDVVVPANVTILSDPDVVVAKVAAPRVALEEEEVAAPEEAAEREEIEAAVAPEGEEAAPEAETETPSEEENA